MPRYRLLIEYDGGPFAGWQAQDNAITVQGVLEQAISGFAGHVARVQCAGRTDAGVHALGQVAHVDIDKDMPAGKVRDATNALIRPHPVTVRAADRVDGSFHARFDAVERGYLYRILNRRAPPALDRGRVWWVARPLDAGRMHAAAQALIGHHDFSTFRAADCQADSPEKTLDVLTVSRIGEEIHVIARARSFLYRQVRNMVGSLEWVGNGRWTQRDLAAALAAMDRTAGGPAAPPQGLFLTDVRYPDPDLDKNL